MAPVEHQTALPIPPSRPRSPRKSWPPSGKSGVVSTARPSTSRRCSRCQTSIAPLSCPEPDGTRCVVTGWVELGRFHDPVVLWVGATARQGVGGGLRYRQGTLSGMLTTLEKSGLISRSRHADDGRRVIVALLPDGTETIEKVFPGFNEKNTRQPSPSG